MSTTFGIKVKSLFSEEEEIVEVAFRSNGIRFINPIASMLNDNIEVIPLDNSAQGIHTIGDIKKEIENSLVE